MMFLQLYVLLIGLAYGITAEKSTDKTPLAEQLNAYCDSRSQSTKLDVDAVNYTAIEKYIDTQILYETLLIYSKLEDALQKLRGELKRVAHCPGFIYGYNCFYIILDPSAQLNVNYFDANALCQSDGKSSLGNIYSDTHYYKIRRHVNSRRHETKSTFINFWTAMTRDIPSGILRLSDGSVASYVGKVRNSMEWRTDEIHRQHVYVSVWVDGEQHDDNPDGYGNVWSTFSWNAALCQYPIISSA